MEDQPKTNLNALWMPTRRNLLAAGATTAIGAVATSFAPKLAAQTTDPKKGGVLRMGMEGGSAGDSFDPTTYNGSVMIALSLVVMNGLVEFDYDGNPTGELLESWEATPGAKEWVFEVRRDITFSNGKTLDADDVIYSLLLHTAESSKSAIKAQLASLEEIKALSPNQVYIRLSEGNADLPSMLGDYHIVVVPKGHTDWSNPIGTGAYTLESFEPGVRAYFKSRGKYWKSGRGNFDAVEMLYITDPSARTAALQSGEIDCANRLDARTVKLLMTAPNLKVIQTKGTGNRYCFVARVSDKPTDSLDLRLALKHGIDREQICKSVFGGFASPGNDHLMDAASPYYNSEMPQFTFDPDKATYHFKRAGLAAGQRVELKMSDGAWSSSSECAQVYQQSLAKAGIDLQITNVAADGYWSDTWLKAPFCAVIWGRRMSPDQTLSTTFGLKSDYNDSNWRNEDFEKLLSQARVELDQGARKIIYDECQKMVAEEAGEINFAIGDFLDGYSRRVQGVHPHPRFDLDDCRVAEKAWFA